MRARFLSFDTELTTVMENESQLFEGVRSPAQRTAQGEPYRPLRIDIFSLWFIMLPDFSLH